MGTSREKSRWLQVSLIILIFLMLAFLAISPSIRAFACPDQSIEKTVSFPHSGETHSCN